jgi:hypothetical protein
VVPPPLAQSRFRSWVSLKMAAGVDVDVGMGEGYGLANVDGRYAVATKANTAMRAVKNMLAVQPNDGSSGAI